MRGHQIDPHLLPTGLGGKKKERERKREKGSEFRQRGSTLSLDFSATGLSNSGKTRGKVDLHGKGYAWVPLLWSFDKLWEVGVFSYLIYSLAKGHFNG